MTTHSPSSFVSVLALVLTTSAVALLHTACPAKDDAPATSTTGSTSKTGATTSAAPKPPEKSVIVVKRATGKLDGADGIVSVFTDRVEWAPKGGKTRAVDVDSAAADAAGVTTMHTKSGDVVFTPADAAKDSDVATAIEQTKASKP